MTSDRKNEENNLECVSCGVDTFSEQVNGPIITRNKHKDWCLLVALWRLDESVKSKPWRVAVQDLTEVCEKYAVEKFAASIRAETLEEEVGLEVADELCVIGRRCLNALENHQSSDGLKDEIEAAMANLNRIIAAIRDAGKKE